MPALHKKRQANDWSRLVDQVRAELIAAGNPKPKLKEVLQVASARYVKKPKAGKKPKVAAPESPIPEEVVVAEPVPAPVVAVAEPVAEAPAPVVAVAEPVAEAPAPVVAVAEPAL